MSNLVNVKRRAKSNLEVIFTTKYTKQVAAKNEPILGKFKKAVNSASNKNKVNAILKSANMHKNNLKSMSHHLTNQGGIYGRPLKIVYKPHENMNNLIKNYNRVVSEHNNNVNKLMKLLTRFKIIKAGGERQLSYTERYR